MGMNSLTEWLQGGEPIEVTVPFRDENHPGGRFSIFCRQEGSGPLLTLLHGFPTCSWDWVKIYQQLRQQHKLLMFDFLGFGDSDKPTGHPYSLIEQADLTCAIWEHFGVEATILVAHD